MLSNLEVRSKVLTSDSQIVELLGAGDNKWKATISITDGPKNGRLLGTNEVQFSLGYGNLTDIRLSRKGEYKMKLKVTHPTTVNHEINDIVVSIRRKVIYPILNSVFVPLPPPYPLPSPS